MNSANAVVMTHPTAFEVSYVINPWMQPGKWGGESALLLRRALLCWERLYEGLRAQQVQVHLVPSVAGQPDLTFAANAAIVFDRKVLLSRFANPERRGEEPLFRSFFEQLQTEGIVDEVTSMPKNIFQEGAGDCLWDSHRGCFWSGYGQRSDASASAIISTHFNCEVVPLELVNPRFYHLDVALAVLEHGEVLYYPGAFSKQSLATLREKVPREQRIEITRKDAVGFCANVVSLNQCLFMTPPSDPLRTLLRERNYQLYEIDLYPFLLSGGAAACLTLRLDLQRAAGGNSSRRQMAC